MCSWTQEEIEQVEEDVANSCAIVNPHYTYTANIDSYSDEEDTDSDSMMEPTELDFDEDWTLHNIYITKHTCLQPFYSQTT